MSELILYQTGRRQGPGQAAGMGRRRLGRPAGFRRIAELLRRPSRTPAHQECPAEGEFPAATVKESRMFKTEARATSQRKIQLCYPHSK